MATPGGDAVTTLHDLEPGNAFLWPQDVDILPTEEYKAYWIRQDGPPEIGRRGETLGKWLVFKHVSMIDRTWRIIRDAVASGELGATGCKVSTNRKDPDAKKDTFVICVYTTKEDMDEVGLKLIQMVRQTIRYKTDEATLSGKYTGRGDGKVSCRVLYWNKGCPKFGD